MELTLNRTIQNPLYTIGKLFINGEYFCDTLEDAVREIKIMHETCIPEGNYEIILNYSKKFKKIMPLLLNIPNFSGIRIHSGNNINHTSGCILVGYNTKEGQLTESHDTFIAFFDILNQTKEKIFINILCVT